MDKDFKGTCQVRSALAAIEKIRPFPVYPFSFPYLGLVNNLIDCAIEGTSGKDHKYGPDRECGELQYIH